MGSRQRSLLPSPVRLDLKAVAAFRVSGVLASVYGSTGLAHLDKVICIHGKIKRLASVWFGLGHRCCVRAYAAEMGLFAIAEPYKLSRCFGLAAVSDTPHVDGNV